MPDKKDVKFEFPVTIYSDVTQYSQVTSKGRCRIFYKGGNRNGTYITEEFAEKLISTLPYTPIKGIYDGTAGDYTDHGRQRYEGKVYGIVPENPNFAWEAHLDEDGKERIYACVDVLLFTSIYEEASQIVGLAQSMELYAPSIEGAWKYIDGKKFFVFEEGCFLGLQVLGDDVEPCFEGAGFYTAQNIETRLENILAKLEEFSFNKEESKGGEKMPVNFKLSDNQKFNMLWNLLNPNFNEEGEYIMNYSICDVYDEYAIAYNLQTQSYERIYYSKDDANDSLEITSTEVTYIVDVTESEKKALDALQTMHDSFEKIEEDFTSLEKKVETCEGTINSLNEEKENLAVELEEVKANFESATAENEQLKDSVEQLEKFKLDVETLEKNNIIDKYADKLSEEAVAEFREKVAEFDAVSLEKELAFALVNTTPTLFSNDPSNLIPKDDELEEKGLGAILSKYE